MGFETFKLIERNIPSEELLKRCRAYWERKRDGNLAELLLSWGFKQHPPRLSWWFLARTFGPWNLSPRRLGITRKFLQLQGIFYTTGALPVTIDGRKIPPDFIEQFK